MTGGHSTYYCVRRRDDHQGSVQIYRARTKLELNSVAPKNVGATAIVHSFGNWPNKASWITPKELHETKFPSQILLVTRSSASIQLKNSDVVPVGQDRTARRSTQPASNSIQFLTGRPHLRSPLNIPLPIRIQPNSASRSRVVPTATLVDLEANNHLELSSTARQVNDSIWSLHKLEHMGHSICIRSWNIPLHSWEHFPVGPLK
ncbi:hypothetical protein FB451DRAFT_1191864 [Mycena latifolia]|nr:hypothetical protein FB451DRAFT_1191864 [Mycena latifolia]